MPRILPSIAILFLLTGLASWAEQAISLHPANPHYFLFRNRPTVLVGSTEHYGAVLNRDIDYVRYLDEIRSCGLNLTRTFSGVYCEDRKSFNIHGNPLAPAAGKLACPWARSTTPGYANGGNRFDLTQWEDAYFTRLKDFVAQVGRRGIVVEMVLFCPFYDDSMWRLSPMNAANNVNKLGTMPRTEVYTLKHPDMLALHETLTRKIVAELNPFDNVYYEVCNEPYFGGVTGEWQDRIIKAIVDTEATLPQKHLIARNIANGSQKIEQPNPAVSIFNFHYATPPKAVDVNHWLNKALGDDETGFKGPADVTYRTEGWEFLLAGGSAYNNLDYSFTPEHPDGTAVPNAPGGGGRKLRGQLQILKKFLDGFDLVKMSPAFIRGKVPEKVSVRSLSEPGRQYAMYVRGSGLTELDLDLPPGRYRSQWLDTQTGAWRNAETFDHRSGGHRFVTPAYEADIALQIVASPKK